LKWSCNFWSSIFASRGSFSEIPRRNKFAIIFAKKGWGFWRNYIKSGIVLPFCIYFRNYYRN
jgi:hypothetical protein